MFLTGTLGALAGTPPNLQEALQAQREVVAAHPTDAESLNDLGNLLTLAGESVEAEATYRRALELDPENVASLYNLALILRDRGEIKKPQKIFLSIVELDPKHAWTYYQLGTLFAEQKYRARAIEYYSMAFTLDRSLASPRVNPHIVANSLATDALLKNYIEQSPSTNPPRMYENPGSVADLFLQQEPLQSAPDTAPEASPEATDETTGSRSRMSVSPAGEPQDSTPRTPASAGQGSSSSSSSEATDPSPAPAETTSPRRIDDSTIRGRRAGEASSTRPGEDLGTKTVGTTPISEGGADRGSTGGVAGEPTSSPLASPEEPSAVQPQPEDSPGAFRPGENSTGRLDLELLPASPATSTTRTT